MKTAIRLAFAAMLLSGCVVATLLSGCSRKPPSTPAPAATTVTPAAGAPTQDSTPVAKPGFINKVWQVSESSAVAPGTLYVFLSEGTLVIASTTGTPSLGKWTQQEGQLTMIEEDIPYKTDVLDLTASTFKIRSHNPGEPVDIAMVLAPDSSAN